MFLRIDTGTGRGHHSHVQTAGTLSKFGIDLASCAEAAELANHAGATVVGLHAHVGSGLLKEVDNWREVAEKLFRFAPTIMPR